MTRENILPHPGPNPLQSPTSNLSQQSLATAPTGKEAPGHHFAGASTTKRKCTSVCATQYSATAACESTVKIPEQNARIFQSPITSLNGLPCKGDPPQGSTWVKDLTRENIMPHPGPNRPANQPPLNTAAPGYDNSFTAPDLAQRRIGAVATYREEQ